MFVAAFGVDIHQFGIMFLDFIERFWFAGQIDLSKQDYDTDQGRPILHNVSVHLILHHLLLYDSHGRSLVIAGCTDLLVPAQFCNIS